MKRAAKIQDFHTKQVPGFDKIRAEYLMMCRCPGCDDMVNWKRTRLEIYPRNTQSHHEAWD